MTEAFQNLKFSEFYTLTYWILGVMAIIVIIIMITNDSEDHSPQVILTVFTLIIVAGIEMYHSHDVLTQEAVREEERLDEIRLEESRIRLCNFHLADRKASEFMKSTGFIIIQRQKPAYLATPNNYSGETTCQVFYNYTVKVREYNNYTGESRISNKLHHVSLNIVNYGEGGRKSYEFVHAIIEDLVTKKSFNLLE